MKHLKQLIRIGVAAAVLTTSAASQAYIVPVGTIDGSGSGLGNVSTVLTLGAKGQATTAEGKVAWNGTNDVATGDAQAVNNTYSFFDLKLDQAADLRFIFNASESNVVANQNITLDSLILTIYSKAGAALFNVGLENGLYFDNTETGSGKSGFGFKLDAASAVDVQALLMPTNRIGLAAKISDAQGGLDTFFVSIVDDEGPGNEVPEPGSLALLGLGFAGLAIARRKTARKG